MLDTPLASAILLGIVSFYFAFTAKKNRNALMYLMAAGFFLGAACAIKWFAVVPLGATLVLAIFSIAKKHRSQTHLPSALGFFNTGFGLLVMPGTTYFLTFIPLIKIIHPANIVSFFIKVHKLMWLFQNSVDQSNIDMSRWWSWIIPIHPIWYFQINGPQTFQGILLLGNPIFIWLGCASLPYVTSCIWTGTARLEAFFISYYFSALYLSWIFFPRPVEYYFYFLPASSFAILAFAYVLHVLPQRHPRLRPVCNPWFFLALGGFTFLMCWPILSGWNSSASYHQFWLQHWPARL